MRTDGFGELAPSVRIDAGGSIEGECQRKKEDSNPFSEFGT